MIRALLVSAVCLAAVSAGCWEPAEDAETVVLVHGLGRTSNSLLVLETQLRREGYRVVPFDYPSTTRPIEQLVDSLRTAVDACCGAASQDVHFVTHSMGGILVRGLLAGDSLYSGRVVMLSPPNQGSEIVDAFFPSPLLASLVGPAGIALGTDSTSVPRRLGPVHFSLGVIAGDRSLSRVGSWLIPGPDDGVVGVEQTRVDGLSDFLVVPASHTMIMNRPETAAAVISFLATGQFEPEPRQIVIDGVTVLDGSGSPGLVDHTVVLEGDRVVALGPSGSVSHARDAEVMDFEGMFLTPGLIDLHVHFPPHRDVQDSILVRLAQFGVTTVLNPGSRPGAGVSLRDRIPSRGVTRVVTAGPIIEFGGFGSGVSDWAVLVSSEEDVRREVGVQAAQGVDFLKYYSGMPPRLVGALIDEADRFGIPVIGHAGATTWSESAELGARMLVHSGYGTPMDEVISLDDVTSASDAEWYAAFGRATEEPRFRELVGVLLDRDVVVVPTLSITEASGLGRDATLLPEFRTELAPEAEVDGWWSDGWRERHPQHGEVSPEEEVLLEEVYWPAVLRIVGAYFEAGVRLGIGTDVGNSWITPGVSYHREMRHFQRAGVPASEIVRLATQEGARALGMLDDVGTIEVGKRADLVVVRTDPSESIEAMEDIVLTFVGGVAVPPLERR